MERGELEGFESVQFTNLTQYLEEAENKYVFMADMSGLIADFFKYRPGQYEIFNIAPELLKINMLKTQTWADVAEKIRARLVVCMLYGRTLILNVEEATVNMRDLDTPIVLPLDRLFHREEFFSDRKPLVRDEEDKNKEGKEGMFAISPMFNLMIL